MPSVEEFCSYNVVVAKPYDGLREVAQRMRDRLVGCVVVVESGRSGERLPVGILTDRDIVVGILAQTDKYLSSVAVQDMMTKNPVTVRASDDVSNALLKMRSAGVRRLPVLSAEGALVGLLSFDDILKYIHEEIGDLAVLLGTERKRERQMRKQRTAVKAT